MFRRLPSPRPIAMRFSAPVVASSLGRRAATALAALGAVALGVGAGLAMTAATIRSDAIGTVRIGPWRLFTDAGSPNIDPYLRARQARSGEVPLASAQGLTATARQDSAGAALNGRCRYRLRGPAPPAQFWTLEAADLSGRPFANAAGRQGFTGTDVLRDVAGQFTVTLASDAEPGNWLPLPGTGRFLLVMRLYDIGATGSGGVGVREAAWPTIEALGCV